MASSKVETASGSRRARRAARAVESFASVAQCIGPVVAGCDVFAVTRGQWSMIDAVRYLVGEVAPAAVSVWTWCIADYEVQCFEGLLGDGSIASGLLVVDYSAAQRNRALLERWVARFGPGSVRVCLNHAKIATVEGRGLRLLARGSMNLNNNPRFEQFDLTEGGPEFEMVRRIEGELRAVELGSGVAEARAASGVGDAWTEDALLPFGGIKPWAK